MKERTSLLSALGLDPTQARAINELASATGISVQRLRYYEIEHKLPTGKDLESLLAATKASLLVVKLKMGIVDEDVKLLLQENAEEIAAFNTSKDLVCAPTVSTSKRQPDFQTDYGQLYRGDCLSVMGSLESDSVDLVFADPPFNLKKIYPSEIDDDLKEQKYIAWMEDWAKEACRILRPGGSLLIWNLPSWNKRLTSLLDSMLTFRHWIAVDIRYSLPIVGRLYPSHYSLLYYINGQKPRVFHPDRLPMPTCPTCAGDLKDYGGYKHKMNPQGVNLADIWTDISPVRHAKYKKRGANELPLKLMDRIIEMTTDEGDIVFDPFGGAGTTYAAAELKRRRWIGCEIGPLDDITERMKNLSEEAETLTKIRSKINCLFTPDTLATRKRWGLWTPESVREKAAKKQAQAQINLQQDE